MPKKIVECKKKEEGEIIENRVKKHKEGFGILKGVGPFNAEDALKTLD